MDMLYLLVVEDDDDIATLLAYHLGKLGYTVTRASDGEEAIRALEGGNFDLVLLDIMLPKIDGLEVLKTMRYRMELSTPVIVESARGEESDIVTALEIGADDYITKPFSPNVLVAKVKSLLRRMQNNAKETTPTTVSTQHLFLDARSHTCCVDKVDVQLTATEFSILWTLAGDSGRVFTRTQLISATKGDDYPVTERSIDVQIATIRHKIGNAGPSLKTVWGVGYKYLEEQT
jgi:two-component system phosphate regulon response regulator PhoB